MRSCRRSKRFIASAVVLASLLALALGAQPASATSLSFTQHRPVLGFQPFDVRPGDVDGDASRTSSSAREARQGSPWREATATARSGRRSSARP
jgi:hypothetical protein